MFSTLLDVGVWRSLQLRAGQTPLSSASGGASVGRFIVASGTELAEFGPVNSGIHQPDEHVRIADLRPLSEVYGEVAEKRPLNL